MLARYVWADIVRNPRRTLSAVAGVCLGVGLFCGVLFFVDGLSASMTRRAVAPLHLDMQRIVSDRATDIEFTQDADITQLPAGEWATISLVVRNGGGTPANEVTVRSLPSTALVYVAGSAQLDGVAVDTGTGNPFAAGPARVGMNIGTLPPGAFVRVDYVVEARQPVALDDRTVASTVSTRESVSPIAADQPPRTDLDLVAAELSALEGVERATPLSIADLAVGALGHGDRRVGGRVKVFGIDAESVAVDPGIDLVDGELGGGGVGLSVEAAAALGVTVGDIIEVALPDSTVRPLTVDGLVDVSRARVLFSSRRGGDLETFLYTPYSLIVSSSSFDEWIAPAFERAIAAGDGRVKSPPIREVDIALDSGYLDSDPATAASQTERIAAAVMGGEAHGGYLLDNITNTLHVAAADAAAAKRLFVFLGLPGALLAAVLSAYAGNVLAEAQRREQATLRVRGADRRHLRRMLALRTAVLTGSGALVGVGLGYGATRTLLGAESLQCASSSGLAASALIGSIGGFVATGSALYLTGRRSIDRQINDDRSQIVDRSPLWRRARLDIAGLAAVCAVTVWAFAAGAFDGTPGSVYFGRAVQLDLKLLVLPIGLWLTGSLLTARAVGAVLRRTRPTPTVELRPIVPALVRRSMGRRPWAIGNAAIVVTMIVALATCLSAFTTSYEHAKNADARFANGSDIRVTPGPTSAGYAATDGALFEGDGVTASTPVVYQVSNVVLRSARTSDPANAAALDPAGFAAVAPISPADAHLLGLLDSRPDAIIVSRQMAAFLKAEPGDTLHVLLARATPAQVEIDLTIAATYERLPGFPDGVDAVLSLARHTAAVPSKLPDFFLLSTSDRSDATLDRAVAGLATGPAATEPVQIDTRRSTLDAHRDQSSLAALNIAGLVDLDSSFAFAMTVVALGIFVFGLLLQRRREYVTLRAQGMATRSIGMLIGAETCTATLAGAAGGIIVGAAMGVSFVGVLRPLFVLDPAYIIDVQSVLVPLTLLSVAAFAAAVLGTRLVARLSAVELLRDE